jgi:hypothetical protein
MTPYSRWALYAGLSTLAVFGGGCAAVGGIFKAGVWVGVIAVIFVIALIAATTGMFRKS